MDLLQCAFDGGEVSLFHGVYDKDDPSAVLLDLCMHIFGRTLDLSLEGQLLFRTHGERSMHNESVHSRKSKCSASFSVSVVLAVASTYHCGENNYSFDALQAYCFGINIKL